MTGDDLDALVIEAAALDLIDTLTDPDPHPRRLDRVFAGMQPPQLAALCQAFARLTAPAPAPYPYRLEDDDDLLLDVLHHAHRQPHC